MKLTPSEQLIYDAMTARPVHSDEWPEFAPSRGCFKVHLSHMRKKGVPIVSTPAPREGIGGHRSVSYRITA